MRGESLVVRQVGPETLVYDRQRHRAHCLGALAAAVWRASDRRPSAAGIARLVSAERREPVEEAAVRVALRRLERAGLVDGRLSRPAEAATAAPGVAGGAGRREALRRVAALTGLTVLSLAVSSPAQVAATCVPNGSSCTSSAQCCSRCCNAQNLKCTGGGPCLPGAGARRR